MALVIGKEFYRGMHNQICGQPVGNSHISGGRGKLRLYSGTQPSTVSSGKTSSGTDDGNATDDGAILLATIDLPDDWMSAATIDGISKGTSLSGTGSAAGTATWARLSGSYVNTSNYLHFMDMPASIAGGGGGVILDDVAITNGGAFTVNSLGIQLQDSLGTVFINDALRNSILDTFTRDDAESNLATGCTVKIYTSPIPSSANATVTGTLLATYTLSTSQQFWVFSDPSSVPESSADQFLFKADFTDTVTASAGGVPAYFRIDKGSYTLQGTCGLTASNLAVDKDPVVNAASLTITECVLVSGD